VALGGEQVGGVWGSREGHAGGFAHFLLGLAVGAIVGVKYMEGKLCWSNLCAMFWGCDAGPHRVASWEAWFELLG